MNKKKLVSLCLVLALLVTAAVGATFAYFTDVDENNNTFTMGNVDITLDEAAVEKNGDVWTANDKADRVKANEYEDVYPGAVMPKDPTIHNEGSYDAYVRAKVTIDFNKLSGMQEDRIIFNGATEDSDLRDIVDINKEWTYVDREITFSDDPVVRTVTYTYQYNKVLAAGEDTTPLFTKVTMPGFVTNEDVEDVGLDEFAIDIIGEAIQTAGFADAAEAWAAYDAE